MLLILLTVFVFSYLVHNGSGYVREEAIKSERKSAFVEVVCGIIISGYAFVRFLELTEHISRHRKYLKIMTEELSPTPDFETIEEEADFHDKELKLLIYKNCLITYHNYFCFRKMDSQIWQIFLNKYQNIVDTKARKVSLFCHRSSSLLLEIKTIGNSLCHLSTKRKIGVALVLI